MSLKTWKEEFYPKEPSKRMSKRAAIEHSFKKWTGLKKSNLEKHGLEKALNWIQEKDNPENCFLVANKSCALCVKYLEDIDSYEGCKKCPLAQHLGNPCDATRKSVYVTWSLDGYLIPMIKALKALLEKE